MTPCCKNASASSLGEAQRADGDRRNLKHANVVCDGTNNNCNPVLLALEKLSNAGNGHRRAIILAHVQALEYNLVELGVSTTRQETVELNQEIQVHILGLRRLTPLAPNTASSGNNVFSLTNPTEIADESDAHDSSVASHSSSYA